MKPLLLYLAMLVGGAAAGAFGVGAYNVVTGAAVVEEIAEGEGGEGEAALADEDAAGPDEMDESGGEEQDAGPSRTAAGDVDPAADGDSDDPALGVEDAVDDAVQTADTDGDPPLTQDPPGVTAAPVVQMPPPDPDSLARVTERYQRLARIFSAMKPDEAAPVLAQLDDAQLEGILLAMQGRNAAPILAEMDPERAAALSRKVLRGNE
ncbi:MAG: hypothetical protein HKN72_06930 [Gemmatimonadetes bacterium]|nr:hypothetical protein [Gemmatimonadota bacterium]